MNAEQEAQTRDILERCGIIGPDQDTAVTNVVGMTEGWAPANPPRPDFVPLRSQESRG